MLTVKEINEVSFGKAGFSGYKPDDVDNFIDEVAESFQQLEAERDEALKNAAALAAQNSQLTAKNAEIQEKLAILAEKIETYRSEEDGIKDAILSAQRLAKDSVQEAKDKAEIILQDAQASARQMLDNAKVDAAKAAKEYMAQADEKREELEELKRQVSAFRASLIEMYKKHLECIDHIPTFRQKEREEAQKASEEPEPAEESAPAQPEPQPQPVPQPESKPEPAPAEEVRRPEPKPQPKETRREPERQERNVRPAQQRPTLHDKVDYSKEQTRPMEEDDGLPEEENLADVGIDLKAYSSIPESLRREKSNHFSNLEFGDDVDLGNKKRKK